MAICHGPSSRNLSDERTELRGTYYRGAQGIIFTYSVDDERTFKSIPRWIADVEKSAGPGCAKILVGNKADVDEKSERQVQYNEAQVRTVDKAPINDS